MARLEIDNRLDSSYVLSIDFRNEVMLLQSYLG